MSYKFGSLTEGGGTEHQYGNVYHHEVHPKWSRVTIGADGGQIDLMLEIAEGWDGPIGILYVIVASRCGHTDARYQSPQPCTFLETRYFMNRFRDFIEGDGRHHFWLMDLASNAKLIYDNNNLIYSYGQDDAVIPILDAKGLSPGETTLPVPHEHHFNSEFDRFEDEIMEYFEWKEFPLAEQDDP